MLVIVPLAIATEAYSPDSTSRPKYVVDTELGSLRAMTGNSTRDTADNPSPDDGLIRDIPTIQRLAAKFEDENWDFRTYVRNRFSFNDPRLNGPVHEIAERIAGQIDCTKCANCCKTLEVAITKQECKRIADHLGTGHRAFMEKYITAIDGGFVMKSKPCPFLVDDKCSVYAVRPQSCRDYPYLEKVDFRARLIIFIQNTGVCPIVYNASVEIKPKVGYIPRGKRRR
jgi:Fe-S-cluster containining protein